MEKKENYFNSPEFQETLHRYESSLQEDHPEYFGSDELSDIAEYYYDSGKRKEAVDVLDYAIQLHPGAAMPLVFKGRIALIDNKDIDTAQHYSDMISDQLDLDCLYLQAEIMITRGNVEEADNFLNNAMHQIDEDDVPDYVLDIATIFIDYNQPDIAAKWLAMSDEDDLLDYREVKARIAFAKGDYEQSEQIFEQLLDEDPYSGKYWNSLAVTQLMSNRINDSITSSEYSIAIDPEDEEALLNKANGLFSLGNFTEAMDYYQRFLKLCPGGGCCIYVRRQLPAQHGQTGGGYAAVQQGVGMFQEIQYQHIGSEPMSCIHSLTTRTYRTGTRMSCRDRQRPRLQP